MIAVNGHPLDKGSLSNKTASRGGCVMNLIRQASKPASDTGRVVVTTHLEVARCGAMLPSSRLLLLLPPDGCPPGVAAEAAVAGGGSGSDLTRK
jgi:hypothetical protein